ncbi:hypothetical protein EHQ76_02015 [Leptospira barantonii]|uniref:Glycosyltransferase RgtA/B/C/D-like domain-containing protein n=1 Tax=Leptospira barantonii TaxID=2023184 RepID=A0A5F2BU95_9LEPT|nr:hypothetical protein [Leptospira barantonii]TGM09552.1 hypothetical protein EHQ76_02015 [Leptospira barantonii]
MKYASDTYDKILKFSSVPSFKIVAFLVAIVLSISVAYYTKPDSSFAADSLMKVLQAKGWIVNDFRSQEIFYLGKRIDSEFSFFPIETFTTDHGEKIGPFPIANTLITSPFVLWNHPGWLIYFCALLFCVYLTLLYTMTKRLLIPLIAAIATPLFHHFISFSDVSVAAILVLLGVLILRNEQKLFAGYHSAPMFLSGALFGLGCWYRPEVLILTACIVFSSALIKAVSKESSLSEDWKNILSFSIGFVLIFTTFVLYNYLNYDSFLGPRVASNRTIAVFDLAAKISSVKSLLLAGNGRLGLFGYSPWYLFIVLFGIWKWKNSGENVRTWILTFGLNLSLVGILTPNDSNIDWGSRYLTCSVFIPLILLNEIKLKETQTKLYKNIILFGFGILIVYSASVNLKVIKLMRKISIQLAQIQSEIPWDSSKVFITQKIHVANTFGLNYLSQKILLIKGQDDLDRILRSYPNEKIVLIEEPFDNTLSDFVKTKFSNSFKTENVSKPGGLLHITEVKR